MDRTTFDQLPKYLDEQKYQKCSTLNYCIIVKTGKL